jgi:soluble lytic murein transglycosylase
MPSSIRTAAGRRTWITAVTFACGLWPASLGNPGRLAPVVAAPQVDAPSALWLVPSLRAKAAPALGDAAIELQEGRPERALPVFAKAASHAVLGGYARLYQGRAELALERHTAALASARHVIDAEPDRALGEAALWLMADAAEAAERWPDAIGALRSLTELRASSPAQAMLRLGRAQAAAGDRAAAARSFAAVFYDHPLTAEAAEADAELKKPGMPSVTVSAAVQFERAEKLFTGRRYSDARRAYEQLTDRTGAADKALLALRLAQTDLHLGRHEAARKALRALIDRGTPHLAEAEFAHLSAVRELRREAEYVALVRGFVDTRSAHPLAERALNELATFYILADEDAKAAEVFDEMVERYPSGAYGDRAAWRAGWWAYRHKDYDTAIKVFDAAAVAHPRADYRPAWLYWTGRAHERAGRPATAIAGYERTIVFYRNSYYGRQAGKRLSVLRAARGGRASAVPVSFGSRDEPPAITGGHRPSAEIVPLVDALVAARLYDDAVAELRWAAREQGSSPFIEATIAYVLNRKGELRPAITAMRRAYPQFMATGGEALPVDLLKIIFPIAHWDLLRRHAAARDLDPYLLAALVAQESTFQADIRSVANAWGLMQIIPGTGRRYAARLGIPRFATARLTNPDVNVRIGTAYLSDLIARFGNVAHALAAYNAGENRVERWRGERPGLETDEFIDDIPFPETQNYVKRILGTAEDYRLLYGTASKTAMRESGR